MDQVIENEKNRIIKLGKEFRKRVPKVKDDKEKDAIKNAMKKEQEQKWKEKETHGYLGKQLDEDPYVHNSLTNNWLTQCLCSHIEGFIMATQEQELDFKETRWRRKKDLTKRKYECEVQSLWSERRVNISCHLLMSHACPYAVSVSTSNLV